ncbi:MAG: lipocalin-like domain-containing protein [Wenzhouxiangellaceae bacterium]|nr:lipocalin-like domain-containing protein [Wenzhouxiangellaceae bacterium]
MKRDLAVTGLVLLACVLWLAGRIGRDDAAPAALDSTALLGTAPESFRRVTGPEPLSFPRDHAAHPGFRSEWWYFTGNLFDAQGRRYGLQFTLFRFGLPEDALPEGTDFSADAAWMAHLAVTDVETGRFLHRERFARGALDLAGATEQRWWLRDWSARRTGGGWRLAAEADTFGVDLDLRAVKPVVLPGERGYSRKGPEPGNASRYYQIPRLEASGRLRLPGRETVEVSGLAWLDREWGSSQLGPGIAGWDWFALQLDDGRDLMLYRLRTDDGEASRFSSGTLTEADGSFRTLGAQSFSLTPMRRWTDGLGVEWPVEWRVRVPEAGLDLKVRPVMDDQRWDASVIYWEGAVDAEDTESGRAVGRGYLELSGYR